MYAGLIATMLLAGLLGQPVHFEWTPATGPVEGYYVDCSADGDTWQRCGEVGPEARAEIAVDLDEIVLIRTQAFDAEGNVGDFSEVSEPVERLPDFDWDRSGLVGGSDLAIVRKMIGLGLADPRRFLQLQRVWASSICEFGGYRVYSREPCAM